MSIRTRSIWRIITTFLLTLTVVTAIASCRPASSPDNAGQRDAARRAEIASVNAFVESIAAANQASEMTDAGRPAPIIDNKQTATILSHYRTALAFAEQVDHSLLEQRYQGWGTHFDQEYRTGLRLVVKGFENPDPATALAGQRLLREWGTWFNAHVEHIRNL